MATDLFVSLYTDCISPWLCYSLLAAQVFSGLQALFYWSFLWLANLSAREACWKMLPPCHRNTALGQLLCSSCQCAGPWHTGVQGTSLTCAGWQRGQYSSSYTSLAAVSVKEAACNFPRVLQLLYSSWVHVGMCSSLKNDRKGKEYRKQRTWS